MRAELAELRATVRDLRDRQQNALSEWERLVANLRVS